MIIALLIAALLVGAYFHLKLIKFDIGDLGLRERDLYNKKTEKLLSYFKTNNAKANYNKKIN